MNMDPVCVNIPIKPMSIILDLDKFYGTGIKDMHITINGKEFIFTKGQIEKFLFNIHEQF